MGKDRFLTYFQINLANEISNLINSDWKFKDFQVIFEEGNLEGKFNGYIDISISKPEYTKSIIAIEIEHLSSYNQAYQNIEKLKRWSHNSLYRKCGLLHIFNEDCNISDNQMEKLIDAGKTNERQDKGFYYDFVFYKISNRRETLQLAKDIVSSKEFRTRLRKLLREVELI